MSATQIPAGVLDKIEKVQALMNNAGTQEEANAAAAALQRILTKYDLEMFEVEQRLGGGRVKSEFGRFGYQLNGATAWRRTLIAVVAQHNFGFVVIHPGSKAVSIIADRQHFERIVETYLQLESILWKMTDAAIARVKAAHDWEYVHSPRAWSDSYRNGFVSGLSKAMREAAAEAVEDTSGGSALVVVKQAELDQAVKTHFPRLESGSRRSVSSGSAYRQGQSAGYSAGGNRAGVGGGGNRAIGR